MCIRDSPTHVDSVNCLRYFAKATGCHAAEVSAPIPRRLADFVYGSSLVSCVKCTIYSDEHRRDFAASLPATELPFQFVSHHGLAVLFDKEELMTPLSYRSGVSIGWADVVFEFPFSFEERRELLEEHLEFLEHAKEKLY